MVIRKSEKPPIRPQSAYSLFVQDLFKKYRDDGKDGSAIKISQETANLWYALSDAEKQVSAPRRLWRELHALTPASRCTARGRSWRRPSS